MLLSRATFDSVQWARRTPCAATEEEHQVSTFHLNARLHCEKRTRYLWLHFSVLPSVSTLVSLCPQGSFSIMFRLFELLPLPCPSHKTMMSWYSREIQCGPQRADRSSSLSMSGRVRQMLIFTREPTTRADVATCESLAHGIWAGVSSLQNKNQRKRKREAKSVTQTTHINSSIAWCPPPNKSQSNP